MLMRCSSCKLLLDRYLEGTLSPMQAGTVGVHLQTCADCTAVLDELKVVDGLLTTVRTPEPAPNFSFAVMAEVRSMPAPTRPRAYLGALFGAYIVVAWAIIAMWLRLAGVTAHGAITSALTATIQFANTMHAIAGGAAGSFGHGAPFLPTFVFGVLALDITVGTVVAVIYVFVRPRLAAHLASIPEVR